MKKYHVVGITTKGYHLVESYENREEGIRAAVSHDRRSMSIVFRDGTTGKRFSIVELENGEGR